MKKANKRASKITYLFVCGFVLLSFSLVGPKAQSVSEAAEIMNPLSPDDRLYPKNQNPLQRHRLQKRKKSKRLLKSLNCKVIEKKTDKKSKKKRRKSFLRQTQQLHLNIHKRFGSWTEIHLQQRRQAKFCPLCQAACSLGASNNK